MAENSKIEWTDHTFNPWVGCTKVSPACDHCYAETWARRTGQDALWLGERRRTSMSNWHQPVKWNKKAEKEGRRYRVFCASLADVFDNQVPVPWRRDLWHYIEQTPYLDWLLLTKRPQNIRKMLPDPETGVKPWGDGWPNVWLGTTCENQTEADRRIPHLVSVPAKVRFLSCEPLLGPLDLRTWLGSDGGVIYDGAGGQMDYVEPEPSPLNWVIAGGESGPGARPMHPDWARSLRDQCAAAGVPFHFKQWGEHLPYDEDGSAVYWPSSVKMGDGLFAYLAIEGHDVHNEPDRKWIVEEPGGPIYDRVGKTRAGRLLDGVEHNGMPS